MMYQNLFRLIHFQRNAYVTLCYSGGISVRSMIILICNTCALILNKNDGQKRMRHKIQTHWCFSGILVLIDKIFETKNLHNEQLFLDSAAEVFLSQLFWSFYIWEKESSACSIRIWWCTLNVESADMEEDR